MNKHHWVKIEITPVHVLETYNGTPPVIVVDPEEQGVAEQMTQYGCSVCDISLDQDTQHTECPGGDTEVKEQWVDSRDPEGRYCGMREDGTSAVEESTQGGTKSGYCGPNCGHCLPYPFYALQNGVWVCAADYDPENPS